MAENLEKKVEEIKIEIFNEDIREMIYHDIKDDCVDNTTGKALYTEKNAVFKISEYKKNKNDGYDCDVALRTMILHTIAYPFIIEKGRKIESQKSNNKNGYKYEIGNIVEDEFVYRSDTINSYYTTLNEFLRLFGDDRKNPQLLVIWPRTNKFNFLEEDGSWENCLLNHKEYFSKLLPYEVMEFLSVVHTIGNFMPVPFKEKGKEFNSPRGFRNKAIDDYWDITLLAIYNWFQKKNNRETEYKIDLIDIVKTEESVKMCQKWFEEFIDPKGNFSWDKFVLDNYMQDFINFSNEEGKMFGIPRELWKGHYKQIPDGDKKPKGKEEFIQFFTNATVAIIARGERVAISAKSKLNENEI